MIDYRDVSFDSSDIEGITLVQDPHLGLCLAGQTDGGFVLAKLASEVPFEAHFFNADEHTPKRIFIPNCGLRMNVNAVLSDRKLPVLGCLIVAEKGISIM